MTTSLKTKRKNQQTNISTYRLSELNKQKRNNMFAKLLKNRILLKGSLLFLDFIIEKIEPFFQGDHF